MLKFLSLIEQKEYLFERLTQLWQETTKGELALLLANGNLIRSKQNSLDELIKPTTEIPPNWQAYINAQGEDVLSAPVTLNKEILGYLIAYKTTSEYLPLLNWAANDLVERLVDEQALQDMTDEVISFWNQLDLVYKITQTLGLHSNLDETLRSILDEVIKVIRVRVGFILLEEDNQLNHIIAREQNKTYRINNQTYLRTLLKADTLTLSNDPNIFAKFSPFIPPPDWQNIILVPIPTHDQRPALLGLVNSLSQNFTTADAKLALAVSEQIRAIIDNFRLHQKLVDQERVRRELEIAAEIQENLLYRPVPEIDGLQIDVNTSLAHEVGGDFYDFICLDDDYLMVVLGEVAGKGIPSAMFTSMIRTVIRLEADSRQEPHLVVKKINEVLREDLSQAELFITVCLVVFNIKSGAVMYANAGHIPGIIYHAQSNTSRLLKATSTPIGVFEHNYTTTQYIHLNDEDILVLFSDGVSEAKNQQGQSFSLERIRRIVHQCGNNSPRILQQIITKEQANFQTASPVDDSSLLVIKYSRRQKNKLTKTDYDLIEVIPFEYVADTMYLNDISTLVTQACRSLAQLPADAQGDDFVYLVELAVSEICTNIIEHAYQENQGELVGYISLTSVGIQIDIFDQGRSFDPDSVPPPMSDPLNPPEGGYGLHIVRQIMDVAEYKVEPNKGNHWHLVKYLPS